MSPSTITPIYIQNVITSIFDLLAPLKSKSFYPKQVKKFVFPATKAHLIDRESAYQSCLRHPFTYNLQQHYRLKKLVKRGILNDTRNELDEKIKARGTWGGIKSVYALKSSIAGEITLSPNEINDFFVNISLPSSADHFHDYLPSKPENLVIPEGISFTFPLLSTTDLRKAWKCTKNKTSTSEDTMGLCPMIINMCFDSHVFIHYLLSLYNSIISSHHIPMTLKRSRIVPIPKKPNPSTPNDMRHSTCPYQAVREMSNAKFECIS
jgi:hypothetical protein